MLRFPVAEALLLSTTPGFGEEGLAAPAGRCVFTSTLTHLLAGETPFFEVSLDGDFLLSLMLLISAALLNSME